MSGLLIGIILGVVVTALLAKHGLAGLSGNFFGYLWTHIEALLKHGYSSAPKTTSVAVISTNPSATTIGSTITAAPTATATLMPPPAAK